MEMIVAGAILLLTIIPNNNSSNKPQELSVFAPSNSPKSASPTQSPTIKPEAKENPITHKVSSGETLDSISKEYYGSSKYWTTLWNDNDFIQDPRIIKAGMELRIRNDKPVEVEELNEKLEKIYEEILSPSPTPSSIPTPSAEVAGSSTQDAADRVLAPAGSFDEAYKQAGTRFGVPWEILYGIHLVETGLRDGSISSGYGTGAQGPMQFMPGTWAAYGIDGNGDGNIDINNAVDAIFAAANFIAQHGGVEGGLKAYGGDAQGMINAARSRGYSQ